MNHSLRNAFVSACLFLALICSAASCGNSASPAPTPVLSDEFIDQTEISLISDSPYGWFPLPSYCDPNNEIDYSQPIDPNQYTRCAGGWIQQIGSTGKIIYDHGCFTGRSSSPAQVLATQCDYVEHTVRQLDPDEWRAAKRQILKAQALGLKSAGCNDPEIMCVSDYAIITIDLIINGQTSRIQWPSSANGLSQGLQSLIKLLHDLDFALID